MPVDPGGATHQSDQLIVDLQHLETVETMLRDIGIRHTDLASDDQDDLLGLARLRELRDVGGGALEVEEILALLRQKAAADRGGWEPTIGKNRVVDAVIGVGHKPMSLAIGGVAVSGHKPMAGAEPEPVDAADIPQVLLSSPDAGRGVRVGVVDTPRAPAEPGTFEHPVPYRAGHAEFVSSLIRREALAAEIFVEGVLDATTGRADSWDTARAMLRLAATRKLDILNLSFGCYTLSGGPPLVIARAIERLGRQVLVVAAAGNHGALDHLTAGRTGRSACWPAAIPPVVAVGAVDDSGSSPPWSPDLPWVTCLAPGVDVIGSYLRGEVDVDGKVRSFDGHARWSGTSFSAALVTGAVAGRTVPGSVSPQQALAQLLAEGALVRPYTKGC
ncbi:S8/S53 family peptidase [Sphaerisporangium perillae]|uniref:S8/S53 family peptidase n=1 Tax=Sphaerisporangium perillae TaxID=2935860 RepID=UPI00200DEA26|nr:S8/S53 family peptidase [Sphaerisporangium perillae]